MQFVYDDGGRAAAGFKGDAGDCVCRAIAIACQKPYLEVYDALNVCAKDERITKRRPKRSSARTGVNKGIIKKYLAGIGAKWVPTMHIGAGCKVHLRDGEIPMGRLVVQVSKHLVAVINGVVHDTYNPDRDESRCVYGYWWVVP
ncbi:MAG: hypothetical protein WC444_05070 [Candidatus Paceibacterota bacterium]